MFNVGCGVVIPDPSDVVPSSVVSFSAGVRVSFVVDGATSNVACCRRRVTFRSRVGSSNLRCRCCRARRLAVRAICPPVRAVSPDTTDVNATTTAHSVTIRCRSCIVPLSRVRRNQRIVNDGSPQNPLFHMQRLELFVRCLLMSVNGSVC